MGRHRMLVWLAALGALALAAGLMPACAGHTNTTVEKTEILLGALNSATGGNAAAGADQRWAYEQAVKDINDAGGVNVGGSKMPLRLVFEDDQSTADGGVAAMRKLIEVDKVDLCLGTSIESVDEAAAAMADQRGMFLALSSSPADVIEDRHFKYVTDLFPTAGAAADSPFQVWSTMPARERPVRIAILTEDSTEGKEFAAGFAPAAAKYSTAEVTYSIVSTDVYTPGTKDYSDNIRKMAINAADALLWHGATQDGVNLVKQIKAQALNLAYIQGWQGFSSLEFANSLAADADYIVHDGLWAGTLGYPGAKELSDQFKATHGGGDSVTIGLPYASVQVVAMAIERAGSYDSTRVRDTVRGGAFKGTVMGDLDFSADGICVTPLLALQWWNGQRMPVWPQVSTWQLEWMPAWDRR